MKWFRLWTDTLDDHKIAQLSDYEFRVFIYLLCCASDEDTLDGTLTRLTLDYCRRTRRVYRFFSKAIETFQKVGLVTMNGDGKINITNWSKRQFKSDNVSIRVRKHREVSTVRNVSCNVSETVPDTDTDTDTDKRIKKVFVIPSIEDVTAYCLERGNSVDAEKWHNYYSSNGWRVGKNPMKDWKASVRTWEKSDFNKPQQTDLKEWSMT